MSTADDRESMALRTTPRRARADEWALVLEASGLEPRVQSDPRGFSVWVAKEDEDRAIAVLLAFERENEGRASAARSDPPLDPLAPLHAITAVTLLLAFFLVTGEREAASAWFARGSADAERILGGEPWRAVTALTLHADAAHALGNAVAGALFFSGVFRVFGLGVGGLLVLAAGAGGNALNAWLHQSGHVAVGASTAVFGALGLLAGRALVRGRARGLRGRAAFVPAAAALALLAMLGTEGERVDVWAHALGLAVGFACGVALAPFTHRLASRWLQAGAGLAALAVLALSWALAWRVEP
jgi:membrane associated rhomboid family serine protease